MGFKKRNTDRCLLMRVVKLEKVILCVYIVNMIMVGDKDVVEAFKREIKKHFNTKEEGTLNKYVGCKVIGKATNYICFNPTSCTTLKRNLE